MALPADALPSLVAVAVVIARRVAESEATIGGQLAGHGVQPLADWSVMLEDATHLAHIAAEGDGYRVTNGGINSRVATAWRPGEALFRGQVDGHAVTVQVDRDGVFHRLTYRGVTLPVKVLPPRAAELLAAMPAKPEPDLSRNLLSPMPGLLVSLAVREGQEVKAGEALAVVEAMKMENVLRAERDATVAKVRAKAGDSLAVDQVILEFV